MREKIATFLVTYTYITVYVTIQKTVQIKPCSHDFNISFSKSL